MLGLFVDFGLLLVLFDCGIDCVQGVWGLVGCRFPVVCVFDSGWLWVSWFAFAFMLFVVVCLSVVFFMVMFGSVLFINSVDVMLCTLMLFVLYWKSCFVDCGALVGVWVGFVSWFACCLVLAAGCSGYCCHCFLVLGVDLLAWFVCWGICCLVVCCT